MADNQVALGIDVGGSGVKGAPVDTTTGELLTERLRIDTPQPSTPAAVGQVVGLVAKHFEWSGPVGVTMPGVVKNGVLRTAANIDKQWIGADAAKVFAEATGCATRVLNDADAAGIAEMHFGAGRGRDGVVVMITLGTGIGCAVFNDGVLLPNTELGHIEIHGHDAETKASARAREEKDLSFRKWGRRVDTYLDRLENLLWPDLIIIGGGVSRRADKFFPYLSTRAELVAATLENEAGIVGAAMMADGQA